MRNKIKIYIEKAIYKNAYEIYIIKENEKGINEIGKPLNFEFREIEGNKASPPTFSFNLREGNEFLNEFAQALIDSGFRDKTISKEGEIKRMDDHLQDMRKLVFEKIE